MAARVSTIGKEDETSEERVYPTKHHNMAAAGEMLFANYIKEIAYPNAEFSVLDGIKPNDQVEPLFNKITLAEESSSNCVNF